VEIFNLGRWQCPVALAVRSARRRDRRGPLSSMGISKIQTETLTQAQKEAPPKRG
jgi:hypothetical protein